MLHMPDSSNMISCSLHFKKHDITTCSRMQGPKIWKNKASFDLESWMDVIWPIHDLILDLGHVRWFSTRRVSAPLPCLSSTLPEQIVLTGFLLWAAGYRAEHPGTRVPVGWAEDFKSRFWHGEEIFWREFGRFPKRPAPSK